jgi:hypothetical protein
MTTKDEQRLARRRLSVSMSMEDLDIVLKALDSADFYSDDEEFFAHLGKLKARLDNLYDVHMKRFQEEKRMADEFIVGLFKGVRE